MERRFVIVLTSLGELAILAVPMHECDAAGRHAQMKRITPIT